MVPVRNFADLNFVVCLLALYGLKIHRAYDVEMKVILTSMRRNYDVMCLLGMPDSESIRAVIKFYHIELEA